MIQMSQFVITFAALVIAVFVYVLHRCLRIGRRPADFPPGPPTIPLLGNLHLIPKDRPYLQFQKWAEEYGPIYTLILGTRTYVILSSDAAVRDLLDKRSNIYSSRPDMYMGQEVASGGLRLVTMKYSPVWRKMHKMIHNILNVRAALTYVPYQDLENKRMMLDILETPAGFVDHIRRYTNSLTTQMIFGFRTVDNHDPKMKQLFHGFELWGELVQGASSQLLDLYPILQKFPTFLRPKYNYARALHKKEMALYLGHWMNTKRALQDGIGLPCFCNDLLRVQEKEQMSDEQAAYLSGSLLEAGSDTTASILVGFVQAMMVFPEVQKKAQEEIDTVVGPDRLPAMDDMENLPYIRGCVKESIRWMPTTVMAAPHGVTQDDEYMGYRIPAGATVICNAWAIHMDPNRNPDPRRFDPTRFDNDNRTELEAATSRDPSKRNNFIFGAGRRLCQGMHIAERSLFLGVSRLLWAFNIQRPIDSDTGKVTPLPDIDDLVGSLTVQPAPFEVTIAPRSGKKALIIQEAWRDAEESLLDGQTLQWKEVPNGMAFSTGMPEKVDV